MGLSFRQNRQMPERTEAFRVDPRLIPACEGRGRRGGAIGGATVARRRQPVRAALAPAAAAAARMSASQLAPVGAGGAEGSRPPLRACHWLGSAGAARPAVARDVAMADMVLVLQVQILGFTRCRR